MRSIDARKPKSLEPAAASATVPADVRDQFVRPGPLSAEELDGAVRRFKMAVIEHALGGARSHHLGDPPGVVPSRRTPRIIAMAQAKRPC
jgi:hypothetical protein